jgi:hypothetical protein
MPDGRMTDYGFNAMASGLREYKVPRVLVMDYRRPLIDFDGFPSPVNDDDPADFVPDDRHNRRVNVLLSNGAVQSYGPDELRPSSAIYAIGETRGANPGAPAVDNGNDNGKGKGGSGGKGKGK